MNQLVIAGMSAALRFLMGRDARKDAERRRSITELLDVGYRLQPGDDRTKVMNLASIQINALDRPDAKTRLVDGAGFATGLLMGATIVAATITDSLLVGEGVIVLGWYVSAGLCILSTLSLMLWTAGDQALKHAGWRGWLGLSSLLLSLPGCAITLTMLQSTPYFTALFG